MFRPIVPVALLTTILAAEQIAPATVQRRDGNTLTGSIVGIVVQRGAARTVAEGKIAVGYRLIRGSDVTTIDTSGVHARARSALFLQAFQRGVAPPDSMVLRRGAEILRQGALSNQASVEYLPSGIELFASYVLIPGDEAPDRYPLAGSLAPDSADSRLVAILRIRTRAGVTTIRVEDVAGARP